MNAPGTAGAYHKSNPAVLVVQAAADRATDIVVHPMGKSGALCTV
jgi:hypothetical protein